MSKELKTPKAINIRDCQNDSGIRKAMGLFKHIAYTKNITQGDLLFLLQFKSLMELKKELIIKESEDEQ